MTDKEEDEKEGKFNNPISSLIADGLKELNTNSGSYDDVLKKTKKYYKDNGDLTGQYKKFIGKSKK